MLYARDLLIGRHLVNPRDGLVVHVFARQQSQSALHILQAREYGVPSLSCTCVILHLVLNASGVRLRVRFLECETPPQMFCSAMYIGGPVSLTYLKHFTECLMHSSLAAQLVQPKPKWEFPKIGDPNIVP